jgi:hypothetical protein
MAAAPRLGTPIPGTTSSMPMQSGLSVFNNPMASELQSAPQQTAQQMQNYGRNGDSMLVHMTPDEVGGLQSLATAMGGSLTTNPDTGLPEANFLKKFLPTILGALAAPLTGGLINPMTAGLLVGAGQTALTGDIRKGLMAGLGAFGGASLGGAAGLGKLGAAKTVASTAGTVAPPATGFSGALNVPGMSESLNVAGTNIAPGVNIPAMSISGLPGAASIAPQAANISGPVAATKTGLAGFGQKFGQVASTGLGGTAAKVAPYLAGYGVLNTLSGPDASGLPQDTTEPEKPYTRMAPLRRQVRYPTAEEARELGTGEFNYFTPSNPEPVPLSSLTPEERSRYGYAEGGSASSDSPTPRLSEFEALMAAYQSANPGAITASMYPTTRAQAGPETMFAFNRGPNTGIAPPSVPGSSGETMGTPGIVSSSNTMTASNLPGSVSDTQFDINRRDGVYSPDPRGPFVLDPSLPGTTIPGMNVSGQGVMPDFKLDPLRINPVDMPVNGTYSPLSPGTTIPGMEVSGDGIMPNFTLDSLKVDPVIIPRTNISSDYGASNSMGNYRGEFGGPSPFSDSSSFSNSDPFSGMGSIYRGEFGGPSPFSGIFGGGNLPKDPDEYEEAKARGGEVGMEDGSFVVDARTVSELGNGSSNAGIEHLARMGGRPVRGAGDGVSDSVPARIGGRQKARVARDEVIFSPEAVSRLGSGSHSKGTKKLYALMSKAHSARKKAGRGQDTKVAKGLTALNGRTN